MEFEELSKLIFTMLKPKLENNKGLSVFARGRSKFEGWLKVELCDSLYKYFDDVIPEKGRIDITFANWAIELKTVNTNYRVENVEKKTRPITKNIKEVIKDIENLKSFCSFNSAVLFIVFPFKHDKKEWKDHLQKILLLLKELKHQEFKFENGIPGIIYFGLIERK